MHNFRDTVLDNAGNRIANVTVTVTFASDGSPASLYADNGITALGTAGVFTSTNGSVLFYAADGLYDVRYSATGFTSQLLEDIRLFDPTDASEPLTISRSPGTTATCLICENVYDGVGGARISLRHVTASAAVNDTPGIISVVSKNSATEVETEYVKMFGVIEDATGGSEDGLYRFQTMRAGTLTTALDVGSTSILATVPFVAPACTASIPSARLPHGTAPSSPTNGDMWTTTAGLFVRINGATVGPLS